MHLLARQAIAGPPNLDHFEREAWQLACLLPFLQLTATTSHKLTMMLARTPMLRTLPRQVRAYSVATAKCEENTAKIGQGLEKLEAWLTTVLCIALQLASRATSSSLPGKRRKIMLVRR